MNNFLHWIVLLLRDRPSIFALAITLDSALLVVALFVLIKLVDVSSTATATEFWICAGFSLVLIVLDFIFTAKMRSSLDQFRRFSSSNDRTFTQLSSDDGGEW